MVDDIRWLGRILGDVIRERLAWLNKFAAYPWHFDAMLTLWLARP